MLVLTTDLDQDVQELRVFRQQRDVNTVLNRFSVLVIDVISSFRLLFRPKCQIHYFNCIKILLSLHTRNVNTGNA